jgi:hypothetical protein
MSETWAKARRWHIFDEGRSLCGTWLLFSSGDPVEDSTAMEGHDCKACCRKSELVEVPT